MLGKAQRVLAIGLLLGACGGSQEPAAAPEPEANQGPAAEPEDTAPAVAPEGSDEPQAKDDADAPTAPEPSSDAPREVRYIQSSEGLKVEVSGVRFFVTASTAKAGGGHTVKVSVKAESMDKKKHSLLSTDDGPLAFAGSVTRKGQTTSFGDQRKGEAEQTVSADAPFEFGRDWPAKGGEKPLANGDSVELDVGLWGVGDDAASRRPVRQFARVKAKVEGNKARATVEPPPNVGK